MAERLPLEEGYIALSEGARPRLIGSYSPQADEYFFPRRKRCPITGGPVEDRLLSPEGVLYSWTYIVDNRYGGSTWGEAGYGVGQVDLPEGTRIQARIKGSMGDWTIGMKMAMDLHPVVTEQDGTELCTFCFEPLEGPYAEIGA